jgi:hypothetical protein
MNDVSRLYPKFSKCIAILEWIHIRNFKKRTSKDNINLDKFNGDISTILESNPLIPKSTIKDFEMVKCIYNLDDKDEPFGLMLVVEGDTIYFATGGYDINKYWKRNIFRFTITPSTTIFHNIDSFVSNNIIRFIDDVHAALGKILMENPQITKLCFTGVSYGGAYLSVMAYIYSQLISYAKNPKLASKDDSIFIKKFYRWFHKNALDATYTKDPSNPYLIAVENANTEAKLVELDMSLLSRLEISNVFTFGSPSPFVRAYANKYNKALGDVHYGFKLGNDFVADSLQEGSSLSWVVKPFNKFKQRSPIGNVIIINKPEYDHGEYFQAIFKGNLDKFIVKSAFEFLSAKRTFSKIAYMQMYLLIKYKKYSTIPFVILIAAFVFVVAPIGMALLALYVIQSFPFGILRKLV